jgi:hypothetical protein
VAERIERFDWLLPPLGKKLGILLLDVRRVGQHHGTEVPRCRGAPDRALVSMPNEKRETTSMIDVRVREHDGIDRLDVDWEPQILRLTFATLSLKETAVKEYYLTCDPQDVT